MSAQEFLCTMIRTEGHECVQGSEASPAQMEEMFAKFNQWKETFEANLVDIGGRLGEGKRITPDGVLDGPFTEVKEILGGFMIISADSIEEAVAITQQCPPVAASGTRVDVRPIHRG